LFDGTTNVQPATQLVARASRCRPMLHRRTRACGVPTCVLLYAAAPASRQLSERKHSRREGTGWRMRYVLQGLHYTPQLPLHAMPSSDPYCMSSVHVVLFVDALQLRDRPETAVDSSDAQADDARRPRSPQRYAPPHRCGMFACCARLRSPVAALPRGDWPPCCLPDGCPGAAACRRALPPSLAVGRQAASQWDRMAGGLR
jgi:hypothetical protein